MGKNKNTILDYLKGCDGELYGRIVRTLKVYRGIDFEAIGQEDVMVVSPDKALEYSGEEGDKYFKVWMAGERIAWCTWANTLVDSHFRWNAKARGENKRDNGDLLGNEPYVSAYLKSYDAVKECSTVYMFPFAAFGKKEEEVEKKEDDVEKESKVMEAAKAARVVMTGSEEERAHKERMKQMEMILSAGLPISSIASPALKNESRRSGKIWKKRNPSIIMATAIVPPTLSAFSILSFFLAP